MVQYNIKGNEKEDGSEINKCDHTIGEKIYNRRAKVKGDRERERKRQRQRQRVREREREREIGRVGERER